MGCYLPALWSSSAWIGQHTKRTVEHDKRFRSLVEGHHQNLSSVVLGLRHPEMESRGRVPITRAVIGS
jgi:hypothetical protein